MRGLTPLERMFVEEFCRFAGLPRSGLDRLQVDQFRSNPAGFVSKLVAASVSADYQWTEKFFEPSRVAIVGSSESEMLMLLVFDTTSGRLLSIEGDALTYDWDEAHEPAYWSERQRVIDKRQHN